MNNKRLITLILITMSITLFIHHHYYYNKIELKRSEIQKSLNSVTNTLKNKIIKVFRNINIITNNLPHLTNKLRNLLIFSLLTLIYLYYKQKTNFKKYYKKTEKNQKVFSHIKPFLKTYKPTFYLPNALSMIIGGLRKKKKHHLINFSKQKIKLKDSGIMNIEWYPLNYKTMPKETPIIAFLLGMGGNSNGSYVKAYAEIIKNNKWRMVILNRRGFDRIKLKSPTFIDKEEIEDFYFSLCKIKEIFNSPIYLCGVSAGANLGAVLLGDYGDKVPIESFFSISNPYNFARISFNLKFGNWIQYFLSLLITKKIKNIYNHHIETENFIKRIKENKNCYDTMRNKYKLSHEIWALDKNITTKISGHENVLDYYFHISCEYKLKDINKPSLFLSNFEDPICVKENIPIDLLYKNDNIITLITNRGGHNEYLSGWDRQWWAFLLSIHYFEYFEKKRKGLDI